MKLLTRLGLLAATALTAVSLIACGGGSDSTTMVVASDLDLPINPSNKAASFATLTGASDGYTFNNDLTLGSSVITAPVKFTFSGSSADSMTYTMVDGNGVTTSGPFTFGSCIFNVTSSSFTAPHSMAVGQTVTVDPCKLNVRTTGAVANGQATSRNVALLLAAASSANSTVTVAVTPAGALTLNGSSAGVVQLVPATGAN